jgi:hypothetical protein
VSWARLLALLGAASCVSGPRPLSRAQLAAAAVRRHAGAFDDVVQATAVALEGLGLRLAERNEREGTLLAVRADGSGYQVDVRSREGEQLVIAVPVPDQPAWVLDGESGEFARWGALAARTDAILEAWKRPGEWSYRPDRNLALVFDAQIQLPAEWARVEPDVSRQKLIVQRFATRRGPNPTMVLSIDRRAVGGENVRELIAVARLALGGGDRLTWPDDSEDGVARVLDGAVVRPVEWHRLRRSSAAWTIRVIAVCPLEGVPGGCGGGFGEVLEGLRPGSFGLTE